jgi:hypothetical protein
MRIACGRKESERPLSRFPLRGKAGAGGFPPRRRHAARQHKTLARIMLAAPPTRGAAAPLVHSPPDSGADALYDANRTFHLLIKPDILTCYQQIVTDRVSLACKLSGPIST